MDKDDKDYINRKKIIVIIQENAHSKCSLNYKVPKDVPIIIHNASYDTHFIINQLAEEFKGELNRIGEIWKHILLFLYQLKKKVIIIKNCI